jgi:hypothetical protein
MRKRRVEQEIFRSACSQGLTPCPRRWNAVAHLVDLLDSLLVRLADPSMIGIGKVGYE